MYIYAKNVYIYIYTPQYIYIYTYEVSDTSLSTDSCSHASYPPRWRLPGDDTRTP